eukprot:1155412-Pelagomonas_calceolata.AAC.1
MKSSGHPAAAAQSSSFPAPGGNRAHGMLHLVQVKFWRWSDRSSLGGQGTMSDIAAIIHLTQRIPCPGPSDDVNITCPFCSDPPPSLIVTMCASYVLVYLRTSSESPTDLLSTKPAPQQHSPPISSSQPLPGHGPPEEYRQAGAESEKVAMPSTFIKPAKNRP